MGLVRSAVSRVGPQRHDLPSRRVLSVRIAPRYWYLSPSARLGSPDNETALRAHARVFFRAVGLAPPWPVFFAPGRRRMPEGLNLPPPPSFSEVHHDCFL